MSMYVIKTPSTSSNGRRKNEKEKFEKETNERYRWGRGLDIKMKING